MTVLIELQAKYVKAVPFRCSCNVWQANSLVHGLKAFRAVLSASNLDAMGSQHGLLLSHLGVNVLVYEAGDKHVLSSGDGFVEHFKAPPANYRASSRPVQSS